MRRVGGQKEREESVRERKMREREGVGEREKQTCRQSDRETDKQTDRQTDTERERERESSQKNKTLSLFLLNTNILNTQRRTQTRFLISVHHFEHCEDIRLESQGVFEFDFNEVK